MLNKKNKEKIIKKYQTHKNDTGSPQVQIAVLTEEIKSLTKHLKIHKKDNSSRRGLIKKINERKKLLKYFQRENEQEFKKLAISLKLRIAKRLQRDEDEKKRLNDLMEEEKEEKRKRIENAKKEKEAKNK